MTSAGRTDPAAGARLPPRCAGILLVRALGHMIARLPQPALLALGRIAARATSPLSRRRARVAARNLALCFPELDDGARTRLLRANLDATGMGVLEALRAWYAPESRIALLYRIEGLEHLQAARANGRGVVLLAAHFTTVELGYRLLSHATGGTVWLMKRRFDEGCLGAEIDRCRSRHGAGTIDKSEARGMLRVLRRGGTVAYAADQDFSFRHAFAPFFGIDAATTTALGPIVQRTGAAVLPYWYRRDRDGRYTLRIDPPWQGFPSGDASADAGRYMAAIEAEVRRCPEQYLWVHRRFKTRPPGEPPLY